MTAMLGFGVVSDGVLGDGAIEGVALATRVGVILGGDGIDLLTGGWDWG